MGKKQAQTEKNIFNILDIYIYLIKLLFRRDKHVQTSMKTQLSLKINKRFEQKLREKIFIKPVNI